MGESFKDLLGWQRAVELSIATYKFTAAFPSAEQLGLSNQLRWASVSIASNIAEGYGRATRGEYLLFLGHARGSNFEVETQLVISKGLRFGSNELRSVAENLRNEVGKC